MSFMSIPEASRRLLVWPARLIAALDVGLAIPRCGSRKRCGAKPASMVALGLFRHAQSGLNLDYHLYVLVLQTQQTPPGSSQ